MASRYITRNWIVWHLETFYFTKTFQFIFFCLLSVTSILGEKSDFQKQLVAAAPEKLAVIDAEEADKSSENKDKFIVEAAKSQESSDQVNRKARQSFSFSTFGPFSGKKKLDFEKY